MRRVVLALVLIIAASATPAFSQAPADAYVDEGARELVRLARVRRTTVDRRIEAYETTARERMSVGLRVRIAEKLLYRRESASRIRWEREGPIRIEVLGAREVTPPVKGAPQVPLDLQSLVPHLAFDPTDAQMLLRFDTTVIRHPLAEGSEAHYRFESGDTTVIRLPDGRTVRLRELRILPRRRDFHLINGSFWLDAETHAVVQAYFKLARDFDLERDDDEDVPGLLEPVRADLEFIAIEYGLWDLRWWLPRLMAARGMVQVGPMRMPLSYERTYAAYTVRADTTAAVLAADTVTRQPCRRLRSFTINIDPSATPDSARQAQRDSLAARRARRLEERRAAAAASPDSIPLCEEQVIVTAAGPDSVLLRSPELPPSSYEGDVELIPESELRGIIERVRSIPAAPWRLAAPRFAFGLAGPGLVRYNRVEGLSLGGRMELDLGPALAQAEARIGVADLEPRGELAFGRSGDVLQSRLAAYRRLVPAPITEGAHGLSASLGALLLGRDEAEYYDALGAELVLRPPATREQWYDLRLYAERQRAVERNTDFSVAHLIDADRVFRENFRADAADQLGATLRLRGSGGQNTAAPRWSGELSLGGEAGDFALFRPEASLRFGTPLPLGLAFGLEAGAGTVAGDSVPAQALWRLGGARTIRGYAGGTILGDSYWRTRAELGRGWPLARLTLFSDAAWAGSRDAFGTGEPLLSAGAGISLLDGLFRIDVARALRAPTGWRLHVYLDGVL